MEFIDVIKTRRSIRDFDKRDVEEEKPRRVIDAAQRAPSACNKQAWKFIAVRDGGVKKRVVILEVENG